MKFSTDTLALLQVLHIVESQLTRIEPVLHLRGGGDDNASINSPQSKRARRRMMQRDGGRRRQPATATATANPTDANNAATSNLGATSPQQNDVGALSLAMSQSSPFQGHHSDSESDYSSDEDYSPDDPSSTYTVRQGTDEDEAVIEDLIYSSPSSILESSIDEDVDDDDSKPSAYMESVKTVDTTTFDERAGEFQKHFDRSKEKCEDDYEEDGLQKAIQHLIDLVERQDLSSFSPEQLQALFNEERSAIGRAMKKALQVNKFGHLVRLINLGSKFSVFTDIVFNLHYAPKGVQHEDDDELNFCRDDQCCVSTLKSKLLNYLINEQEYGAETMHDWRFGGKTDVNVNDRIAIVDLIPFLLDKTDSESEMEAQYTQVAEMFGLKNYLDLMVISYCLLKMHLILHQKSKPNKVLQIHVASAATAKYVFGLKGINKYLRKVLSKTFCLSFGFHPQGWLMGIGKNDAVYPKPLRDIMARHLIGVYESVHPGLAEMETTSIYEIFGCKQSSIDMAIYSCSAKELDSKGLLNLDKKLGGDATAEAVREALLESAVSIDIISFITKEMAASSLALIMNRLRSFRASHRLHYLASIIDQDKFDHLPEDLQYSVNAVATTLGKSEEELFNIIKKIRQSQDHFSRRQQLVSLYRSKGGEEGGGRKALVGNAEFEKYRVTARLTVDAAIEAIKAASLILDQFSRRQYLAAIYRNHGGEAGNGREALIADADFEKYRVTARLTVDAAIEAIKAASLILDQFSRRQYLAAIYRNHGGEAGNGREALIADADFEKYRKASNLSIDDAIEAIKSRSQQFDNFASANRLVNQLARKYNDAEDGNDDAYSLDDDEDLNIYCRDAGIDRETAIKRVKDTASSYNATFWRNYRALKIYIQTYPEDIRTIEEKEIVTIKQDRLDSNNRTYRYLYSWLYTMNGYATLANYGLVAHKRPGSVEYEALSNLGVSFVYRLNKEALGERLTSSILEREAEFGGDKMNF